MASSSRGSTSEEKTLLSDEELLVTRANYRVIRLKVYNSQNRTGKPYQVVCERDDLNPAKSKPICLY
jgi:hypothetical protein